MKMNGPLLTTLTLLVVVTKITTAKEFKIPNIRAKLAEKSSQRSVGRAATSTQYIDCSSTDCDSVTCNEGADCTISCVDGGCDDIKIVSNNAYDVIVSCQSAQCSDSEIQIEGSVQNDVGVNCSYSNGCSEAKITMELEDVGDDIIVDCGEYYSDWSKPCYKAEISITATGNVGHDIIFFCDANKACMESKISIDARNVTNDIEVICAAGSINGDNDASVCKKAEISVEAGCVGDDLWIDCLTDNACEEAKIEVEVTEKVEDNFQVWCVWGSEACKDSEISLKVEDYVGGDFGIQCWPESSLTLAQEAAMCQNMKFSAYAGKVLDDFEVDCRGPNACENAEISIEINEVTDEVRVWCNYQSACQDAEITIDVENVGNQIFVNCTNEVGMTDACESIEVSIATDAEGAPVYIYCGNGENACANAEFDAEEVANLTVYCGECENADIKCGQGQCILFCEFATSCEGVEVDAGDASSFQCNPIQYEASYCDGVEVDESGDSDSGSDDSSDSVFANANANALFGKDKTDGSGTDTAEEHISITLSTDTIAHLWAIVGVVLLSFIGVCVCMKKSANQKN